jgi:hypothetical protein
LLVGDWNLFEDWCLEFGILPLDNPPSSPFAKGGKRGILHYAPCSLLLAISDRSDLLPHKDEIANPKTEKGDGHKRNQMWDNNEKALQKRKWTLETTQRKSFQGSHEDQRSCGLSQRIKNRCSRVIIEGHGGKEGDRPLNLFMFNHHIRIHTSATLTDRSHRVSQKTRPQTDEEGEKYPYG